MRITGGVLGGRRLKVPPGNVRPTKDRVRESLFGILGDRIPGARVLDLFAGSGAMGLEAWSRGAATVYWVENRSGVFRVLRENVTSLCDDTARPARCYCRDAFAFLRSAEVDMPFDIILADPPYALYTEEPVLERLTCALGNGNLLSESGLVVLEHAGRYELPELQGWRVMSDRRYGDTGIKILIQDCRGF